MKARQLVFAFASLLPDGGAPEEIVYFPEGEHKITATVDGKPQTVTVKIPADKGAQIAASLQAALDRRNASNVRPWFDFEHKRGVASALPKAFRYEPGKGVMCAVEWTGSGKAAIEGRDFSYFSPEFYLGDDGIPDGLPERGPLGALVNEPAFREIPRIAASDAATDPEPNQPSAMSKLIFAALAINASDAEAETAAVTKIGEMKSGLTEKEARIAKLEAELAELKGQVEAAAKEKADEMVKCAVADGRIAAKDAATQDKFRAKIAAGDTFAVECLTMLPKQNAGLGTPIIQGGAAAPAAGNVTPFETKAQALVTAGQAKTLDEALGLVAASDPTAYGEYLKTLHKD